MRQEYSAGIVVYRQDQGTLEYLLLHYTAGHWDFPKGHIEPGESKQKAAARELFEETGLQTTFDPEFEEQFSYVFTTPDGQRRQKTVYFFTGQTNETQITLSDEHTGYAWLSYGKAYEQLTYENAKQLLKKTNAYVQNKEEPDETV